MFFDTVRYQRFDGKLWCPLFFYLRKFSMPELFWNIKRTMYKVPRHCEKKDFQRNLVISPFFTKDVSIPEFIWNTEGFPYDVFRYCKISTFRRKVVMSPVFLSSKFVDARKFLKHRTDHLQSFSALFEKRFPTESSDLPFLCKRCFDTRNYVKHERGPLRNISVLREKLFEKKTWYTPASLFHKNFRRFLKQRRVPLRNFLVLWDKKFDKNLWNNPSSFIR